MTADDPTMSSAGAAQITAGKHGLMDMLAGGHVDEVTFRQATDLLRAEDWEALRLLLAGACHLPSHSLLHMSI